MNTQNWTPERRKELAELDHLIRKIAGLDNMGGAISELPKMIATAQKLCEVNIYRDEDPLLSFLQQQSRA